MNGDRRVDRGCQYGRAGDYSRCGGNRDNSAAVRGYEQIGFLW